MVERCLAKANVAGSSPVFRSITVPSPSGKAKVCKTFIPRFKSGWYLQKRLLLEVAIFIKKPLPKLLKQNAPPFELTFQNIYMFCDKPQAKIRCAKLITLISTALQFNMLVWRLGVPKNCKVLG